MAMVVAALARYESTSDQLAGGSRRSKGAAPATSYRVNLARRAIKSQICWRSFRDRVIGGLVAELLELAQMKVDRRQAP